MEKSKSINVGVMVRRTLGITRWAKWAYKPIAIAPAVEMAAWTATRVDGEATDFYAGTVPLTLYRTDTEGYLVGLSTNPPSAYVVLRRSQLPGRDYDLHTVTASAYEAQDFSDAAEDLVEQVALPDFLHQFIWDFVDRHHTEEEFVKRKRRPHLVKDEQDGIGDARIRQVADVYRTPQSRRERKE